MPKALTKRQNLAYTINKMELQSLLESDSDSKLEIDILYLNHLLTKQYLKMISSNIDRRGPKLIILLISIALLGKVGLDWVGLRLGWAEAKGAEIDLAININIDSEIREGRAGLSWGWAEAKGASKIPSNIDRRLPILIAILGKAKGAEINLAINIDSEIRECREGLGRAEAWLGFDINSDIGKGRAAIFLAISVLIGGAGLGWDIDSNIGIDINIGEGRAGLSLSLRWLQTILLSIYADSPNLLPGHWHVFQKLCDSM
ncbi:hypothetical protein BY996DRAFT_6495078 [Phakopsora pachyrhizi]|nr:hypothetical protein BY996DRAFT_6495078 [Phakopsora pachyrhizi]